MSTSQLVPGAQNAADWTNMPTVVDFTDPKTPHDRILVVGTQKFYVYSGHLSAASEFFRTMFNSEFKEKNEEEIEIKDVDPQGFHTFLKLMHPYNKDVITKDNFPILVEYSHRFLARFAFTMCEEFILANSAKLDAINLLEMAFKYNWHKIKAKVGEHLTASSYVVKCRTCLGHPVFCTKCIAFEIIDGIVLNKTSIIGKESKRIVKLPTEIQLFILNSLMEKNNRP